MFVRKLILLKGTSPLHKIRYLTGQESTQSFLLWTLRANLSSVNSEEPFDVRHYLSKTLQLQFVLKTLYKEYRIGLWMVPLYYLSLTCGLFPTVGRVLLKAGLRPTARDGPAARQPVQNGRRWVWIRLPFNHLNPCFCLLHVVQIKTFSFSVNSSLYRNR